LFCLARCIIEPCLIHEHSASNSARNSFQCFTPRAKWANISVMNANAFRRVGLIGCTALTLSAGGMNARAHGGGCYGGCFWPFIPLAFGIGAAVAAAASSHSQPVYVYAPPSYPYYSPPVSSAPASAAAAYEPAANHLVAASQPPPVWFPSSPGAGHWVPDPMPYSYATRALVNNGVKRPTAREGQTVTVTHSPGTVPVYVISHQRPGGAPQEVYN